MVFCLSINSRYLFKGKYKKNKKITEYNVGIGCYVFSFETNQKCYFPKGSTLLFKKKKIFLFINAAINNSFFNKNNFSVNGFYFEKISTKKLSLIGLGFKVISEKINNLIFYLGFSHFIKIKVPNHIQFKIVNPQIVIFTCSSKQQLGEFMGFLKRIKLPDARGNQKILLDLN